MPKMPEAVLVAEAVATTTGPRETRRPWTVRPHALRRIYKNSLGTDESGNTTLVVKFIFAGQASKVARMGVADWRRGIGQGDTASPARTGNAKQRRDAERNTREAFEFRVLQRLKKAQAARALVNDDVEHLTPQKMEELVTPKRRVAKAIDGKRQAVEAAIEAITAREAQFATPERLAIRTPEGKRRAIEGTLAGATAGTMVGATAGTTVGATAGAAAATAGAATTGRSKKACGLRARTPKGVTKAKGAQEAHMDYIYKELTRGERMHRMVRASAAI